MISKGLFILAASGSHSMRVVFSSGEKVAKAIPDSSK